jgi:hypothetical protein
MSTRPASDLLGIDRPLDARTRLPSVTPGALAHKGGSEGGGPARGDELDRVHHLGEALPTRRRTPTACARPDGHDV